MMIHRISGRHWCTPHRSPRNKEGGSRCPKNCWIGSWLLMATGLSTRLNNRASFRVEGWWGWRCANDLIISVYKGTGTTQTLTGRRSKHKVYKLIYYNTIYYYYVICLPRADKFIDASLLLF